MANQAVDNGGLGAVVNCLDVMHIERYVTRNLPTTLAMDSHIRSPQIPFDQSFQSPAYK